MRDAATEAKRFAEGKNRVDLDTDRMLVLAIIKDVEIIGEAASKVSSDVRDAHPQIPWRAIIDMRNHLTHGYFNVDYDQVWSTLQDDLPPLIQQLTAILTALEADSD